MTSVVLIEELPTLFHRSSTGAVVQWGTSVVERGGVAAVQVSFGQVGGEIQVLYKDFTEGKNIGKKNETTPTRQAILEATSVWKKKKDKGYSEEIPGDAVAVVYLPMLAHDFRKRSHNISYPCFVQPKLEGVRCLAVKVATDRMEYLSRNGKKFKNLEFLTPFYLRILEVGGVMDGEIFNPSLTFQDIAHRLKSPDVEDRELFHWVYDFPSYPGGFQERSRALSERLSLLGNDAPIEEVETYEVPSEAQVYASHEHFVHVGFEGTIIRNVDGDYRYNYRSSDLQKYKDFEDAEYEVIDVESGTGRDSDIGNFICLCPRTGLTFGAPSVGDRSKRQDYLLNKSSYVGKLLTVRYQRLSDAGIPYIPKGIAVRDYE